MEIPEGAQGANARGERFQVAVVAAMAILK